MANWTIQERRYRKAVMQTISPVYEMLTGQDEASAYTYGELCKEVARLLQEEANRAREMDAKV